MLENSNMYVLLSPNNIDKSHTCWNSSSSKDNVSLSGVRSSSVLLE